MLKIEKFILSGVLLLTQLSVWGQNNTASPYTRFGFGEIADRSFGAGRGRHLVCGVSDCLAEPGQPAGGPDAAAGGPGLGPAGGNRLRRYGRGRIDADRPVLRRGGLLRHAARGHEARRHPRRYLSSGAHRLGYAGGGIALSAVPGHVSDPERRRRRPGGDRDAPVV